MEADISRLRAGRGRTLIQIEENGKLRQEPAQVEEGHIAYKEIFECYFM